MALDGKAIGLLPPDFLGIHGLNFSPNDASGMLVLPDSFPYNKARFDNVKKNLGIGEWNRNGALLRYRDRWANTTSSNFLLLSGPRKTTGMGFVSRRSKGFGIRRGNVSEKDWIRSAESFGEEAVCVYGDYKSTEEFLTMPEHLMVSQELNACCRPDRIKSGPHIFCTRSVATTIVGNIMQSIGISELTGAAQKLSVRFTLGRHPLLGQHMASQQIRQGLEGAFRSSIEVGCKGGSLGYHMVTSSEGRNVLTLHGTLNDLYTDLTTNFKDTRATINGYRKLLREGELAKVLQKRVGEYSGEVMGFRITNPTPVAAIACAMVLGGTVYFDTKTNALYPIRYDMGGNLELSAACAIIIEILTVMRDLEAGVDRVAGWHSPFVSFEELF